MACNLLAQAVVSHSLPSSRRAILKDVAEDPNVGSDLTELWRDLDAGLRVVAMSISSDAQQTVFDPLQATVISIRKLLNDHPAAAVPSVISSLSLLREHLLVSVRESSGSSESLIRASEAATQVLHQVGRRVDSSTSRPNDGINKPPNTSQADVALIEIAKKYGADARRGAFHVLFLYMTATIFMIASFIGAWHITESPAPQLAGRFWAVAGALLVAIVLAYHANTRRRQVDEAQRLERQLTLLPSYLAPLPDAARSLMRAAMIQRVFPRLLEDDDPLRESEWFPGTDHLLLAIDPDFAVELDDMAQD
jgi:hypothetical protein